MTIPQRIQRKRTAGWRMPPNTIYVGRGSIWGNPFVVGQPSGVFLAEGTWPAETLIPALTLEHAIKLYRDLVDGFIVPEMFPHGHNWNTTFKKRMHGGHASEMARVYLRGKNLACWCKPGTPCHADVLLEIANQGDVQ